jgi:cell division protease FtsH
MVLDWGMGKKLHQVALGTEQEEVFLGQELGHRREYSEITAREVDEEVTSILGQAYQRAKKILLSHKDGVERLVKRLLEREELPGEEVLELIGVPPREDGEPAKEKDKRTKKDKVAQSYV